MVPCPSGQTWASYLCWLACSLCSWKSSLHIKVHVPEASLLASGQPPHPMVPTAGGLATPSVGAAGGGGIRERGGCQEAVPTPTPALTMPALASSHTCPLSVNERSNCVLLSGHETLEGFICVDVFARHSKRGDRSLFQSILCENLTEILRDV